MKKILIANRGEIALRIARTASEMGIATVAVYSEDDVHARHRIVADEAVALDKAGVSAYLDQKQLISVAMQSGCDGLHPGYGFLSESAEFARACAIAGITFIGPDPKVLDIFGDKSQARKLAISQNVAVARGSNGTTDVDGAKAFMKEIGGPIMLKAVAGGGGRGMRPVLTPDDVEEAFQRCQSEALAAFGRGDIYAEQLIQDARHIEVQIVGDGTGHVRHLFERDCTLQRRHQKLIEIAPSPFIGPDLRRKILADAVKLGTAVEYQGLGTVEFLVDGRSGDYIFIECNPRLQVEHTVTEEIMGLDLVRLQFALASQQDLDRLLVDVPTALPNGFSIQARVNMESMQFDGNALPTGGRIRVFEPPTGPGVRVDTFGYTGYETVGSFDSLLAKVIVSGRADFKSVCHKTARALDEFRIEGVETNISYLTALLHDKRVLDGLVNTAFVETNTADILEQAGIIEAKRVRATIGEMPDNRTTSAIEPERPAGSIPVRAPMSGVVVDVVAKPDVVQSRGATLFVIEAMKLEHSITAECIGVFVGLDGLADKQQVRHNQILGWLFPESEVQIDDVVVEEVDPDHIRPDLAEVLERRDGLLDAARSAAVARRHKLGKNTVRENLDLLLDADSFVEYGGLTLAMQRSRHSEEELVRISPADGVVTGLGRVNGDQFDEQASRCAVMAYDYTVFAGTQGFMAHRKMDRIVGTAKRLNVPLILFAEGGGGRPGDTDYVGVSALEFTTFEHMAHLSGNVPLIGIVSGRCFAGNAALLGCCDVIIATRDACVGMAGPAMIEGGGLGRVTPEEIGPVDVQSANGVIDVVVENETEAVALAKTLMTFIQGGVTPGDAADQRPLRHLVPENRKTGYDVRTAITTLSDTGSFVELRREFGRSVVTGFIRIEGRAVGLIANDCRHLGGALDAPSADKITRFLELCDSYGLPVVTLCDTPGFMVGPDSEKTATVRHFSRVFVAASHIKVPVLAVILRKAYGLGAQAMVGGNLLAPIATVAWPTAELGAMGVEGSVKLAWRKELEAMSNPLDREAFFLQKVEEQYAKGKALSVAGFDEIDDVIDPANTRMWLSQMLSALPKLKSGRPESGITPW